VVLGLVILFPQGIAGGLLALAARMRGTDDAGAAATGGRR